MTRAFTVGLCMSLASLPLCAMAETIALRHADHDRRFILTLPDKAPRSSLPLVIVLHGAFQSDETMVINSLGLWDQIAHEDAVAVAYPNALKGLWDTGAAEGGKNYASNRQDLAFLDAVMAEVKTRAKIDSERIFMVGFSMGGQMTYAYACQRPGVVRAIATAAMPLPEALRDTCTGQALPALVIQGVDDPMVPFDGSPMRIGFRTELPLMGFARTVDLFATNAGCTGSAPAVVTDDKDDGTVARLTKRTGCTLPVWGMAIEGMGHYWPGGRMAMPDFITGKGTEEVHGAPLIWDFFKEVSAP